MKIYTHFSLLLSFAILVALNKEFVNVKFIKGMLGQLPIISKFKHLQFLSFNCFLLKLY